MVVTVFDGDTVIVRTSGRKVRVRLDEIDAPEFKQDGGEQSRRALADLIMGRRVRVVANGIDDYGRIIGRIYLSAPAADGVADVNAEMVRSGNAWAYRQYLRDEALLALEDEARRARRGLWSRAGAVPPWEYRHSGGSVQPRPRQTAQATGCGSKRYCRQMDDCEEAIRYLKCGLTRLDGDGDGIPCEALCR